MSFQQPSHSDQEHTSMNAPLGGEVETPMQRSASPPPLQLMATSEGSGFEEESEGMENLEMGGETQSDQFAAAPPPPNDGAGGQFPIQRTGGGDAQEEWDTPISGSAWAGKPARVTSEGYQLWPDRDRVEGTQVAFLAFNTYVNILNEYTGMWLEVITQNGEHGFLGIPDQNLALLPEEDPTADMYLVQSGESAYSIAEAHYSEFARFGADLRYFIALMARLNGIDIGNDVDSWRDTQLDAGQVIFLPTIYYATEMEGIVNSGSYTAEGIRFIQDAAAAIERIRQDIEGSLSIAQGIVEEGWLMAIFDGFVGATEDKIQELIRRFKIVAATTAAGALIAAAVTGGAATLAGAQLGMQLGNAIVNGIELFEGIAGILELAAFFVGELVNYLTYILNPDELADNVELAGQTLGNAVLRLITEVTSEIVGNAMSPGGGNNDTDGGNTRPSDTSNGTSSNNTVSPDTTNNTTSPDSTNNTVSPDTTNQVSNPEVTPDTVNTEAETVNNESSQTADTTQVDVPADLSNRAQQLGLNIPPGHLLWQHLDARHLDLFESIPETYRNDVAAFILQDNDYTTPDGRLNMLTKVSDWGGLYTFATDRGVNHFAVMAALSNPAIRSLDALGNLLDRFTIDEVLQNWSIHPGALPEGADPYNTGVPATETLPGAPDTSLDPGALADVDAGSLSGHRLTAYNFFTGQGLTARDDGGTLVFFSADGAVVARVDANSTTFPYSGYGGDVVAPAGMTTTVLGRYADLINGGGTSVFIGQNSSVTGPNSGGLNVLNVPDWTLGLNVSWLMDAINRGDNIRLISDPAHVPNYFGGDGALSVTAFEIGILIDQGILSPSVLPEGLPFTPDQLLPSEYLGTVGRQRTGGN